MIRASSIAAFIITLSIAQVALSQPTITIDRDAYAEQMRGFWLGQTLANWTGRLTEAARTGTDMANYPFFTDANWGNTYVKQNGGAGPTIDWVLQNPWRADDDTDIEYVYTHLQSASPQPTLTATQIRDGWTTHINGSIWVSNSIARTLMGRGVLPGATSLPVSNSCGHMIDAQLTTEIYGAFAPAMPSAALALGDLPVRTTAHGYAAHASQYFQLLHTHIPLLPSGLTPAQQTQWLNQKAREFIPDTSKTADIIDFVTNAYVNNSDKNDWESTRDGIYNRYQANPGANGFVYRGWYESSVNFASGVMALLYGQGDYARTVQIGTLSGWDADNPTATMGGLIGMLVGEQGVRNAMSGTTLSNRYLWSSTRDGLTDYLPSDSGAEDNFNLIADRMIAIVDQVVAENGGTVDLGNDQWVIPLGDAAIDPLQLSPTEQRMRRSANMTMILDGQTVNTTSAVTAGVSSDPARFADGVEHDFTGREIASAEGQAYSTKRSATDDVEHIFTVEYATPVSIDGVRFIEGDHFEDGGWFESATVEVLLDGTWESVIATLSTTLDEASPFQIIDFDFAAEMEVTGIRILGMPGGTGNFVTIAELDGLVPVPEPMTCAILLVGALAVCRRRRCSR